MNYIVKNVPNTSNEPLPNGCSCWLDYWENKKGEKAYRCAKCGSYHNLVGAHVYCLTRNDRVAVFIVPLCSSCNQISTNQEFSIDLEPVDLREK